MREASFAGISRRSVPWPFCFVMPSSPILFKHSRGNPAILHGGPFASIALWGTNTVSNKDGIKPERICSHGSRLWCGSWRGRNSLTSNVYHRASNPKPVLVATVRACGIMEAPKRRAANTGYTKMRDRICQPAKHIGNVRRLVSAPIVAINHFPTDSAEEIKLLQDLCREDGVEAFLCKGFAEGEGHDRTGIGSGKSCGSIMEPVPAFIRPCRSDRIQDQYHCNGNLRAASVNYSA